MPYISVVTELAESIYLCLDVAGNIWTHVYMYHFEPVPAWAWLYGI